MSGFQDKVAFIWSVADLLRGDYKPHEYGKVILPLTVLRRLDCVLEPTKADVLKEAKGLKPEAADIVLRKVTRVPFYNTSPLDFQKLLGDPNHIAAGLRSYINGFSADARETFESYKFDDQIDYLDKQDILYLLIQKFAAIDLHPNVVPNTEMGSIFEELIRKFSEQSNETAGEHFTPREVVRLMVDLLLTDDADTLTKGSVIKTMLDPACGTGGMLSVAEERLHELNPAAKLVPFGEEVNPETWAICRSDMMIKGEEGKNIVLGNSFSQDAFSKQRYDYFLCNPPFGVEWKKVEKTVREEAEQLGFAGRFGAGLPRVDDGAILFLQHIIAKWKSPADGGARTAIVFNGSRFFAGSADSGEDTIRRWIIENDWVEAIIGLPDQLFYNTGINTYIWILTNRKRHDRRGKVQLVNAASRFRKLQKNLGYKRNYLSDDQIAEIVRIYGDFQATTESRIVANEDFLYRQITIERPLRVRYRATETGLRQLLASKPVLALVAGNPEMRDSITSAFDTAGKVPTVDKRVAEKEIAAALRSLHGIAPRLSKEMLRALAVREHDAPVTTGKRGAEADPILRDTEDVPMTEDVTVYFEREVLPYVPDAWVNEDRVRVGCEIPFNRYFFEYRPMRPLSTIDADIVVVERHVVRLLENVTR
jgi:type I restriction enzyme M protein